MSLTQYNTIKERTNGQMDRKLEAWQAPLGSDIKGRETTWLPKKVKLPSSFKRARLIKITLKR